MHCSLLGCSAVLIVHRMQCIRNENDYVWCTAYMIILSLHCLGMNRCRSTGYDMSVRYKDTRAVVLTAVRIPFLQHNTDLDDDIPEHSLVVLAVCRPLGPPTRHCTRWPLCSTWYGASIIKYSNINRVAVGKAA